MLKILMHGSGGMMGKTICKIVETMEGVEIGAGVDPFYDGSNNAFPVFKSLEECNVKCEVCIDFSVATACDGLIDYCISKSMPVVLCTTGLTNESKEKVKEATKSIAVFQSANMSLGVNLISNLLKKMSRVLYDSNFDIEIVEKHHNKKIDAPSGTALFLANSIEKGIDEKLKRVYDRSMITEKRDKNELGIHAVRGGTIIGEHSVIYAGLDEVIELKHTAYSKEIFAVGAINAAKFLKNKTSGRFDMEDLFGSI